MPTDTNYYSTNDGDYEKWDCFFAKARNSHNMYYNLWLVTIRPSSIQGLIMQYGLIA